jgi:hypothetical protein
MKSEEKVLSGGRSAENVVLIGNTVHRSKGPNFKFCHSVLQFLSSNNFSYSPAFLGIDDHGREMLSYLKGEVPFGITLSDHQMVEAIKILSLFHDLISSSPLCKGEETICHNDFAPWNIIINQGSVVGFIDFDDAAPGPRVDDLAYFVWTFLDLGISKLTTEQQIEKLSLLVKSYGLAEINSFVPALFKQQNRILKFRKRIVLQSSNFEEKEFSKKAIVRIEKSIEWVKENQDAIENCLIKIT